MKNNDIPAFPRESFKVVDNVGGLATHIIPANDGMTLRDYFAGQVIAGIMSGESGSYSSMEDAYKQIAKISYGYADAMLEERNK